MNIIQLYYLTDNGCDWLNQEIYFDNHDLKGDNWKHKIDKYVLETQNHAKALEDKWKGNGEDVSLWLDSIPLDIDTEFYKKIVNYIDKL